MRQPFTLSLHILLCPFYLTRGKNMSKMKECEHRHITIRGPFTPQLITLRSFHSCSLSVFFPFTLTGSSRGVNRMNASRVKDHEHKWVNEHHTLCHSFPDITTAHSLPYSCSSTLFAFFHDTLSAWLPSFTHLVIVLCYPDCTRSHHSYASLPCLYLHYFTILALMINDLSSSHTCTPSHCLYTSSFTLPLLSVLLCQSACNV